MKGSSSLTSRSSCKDSLSSISMKAVISSLISGASAARRAAFGCMTAAADSSCSAASFLILWARSVTIACRSGKSPASSATKADFRAAVSASRDSRNRGSRGTPTSSETSVRYDRERSERRLCSAVKMCAEASATVASRAAVLSRVHELQALCASRTTTTAAKVAITKYKMTVNEIRLSIVIHSDEKKLGRGPRGGPDAGAVTDRNREQVGQVDQREHPALDGHEPGEEVDARRLGDARH